MQKDALGNPIHNFVCTVRYSSNTFSDSKVYELKYIKSVTQWPDPTDEERKRYGHQPFNIHDELYRHAKGISEFGVDRVVYEEDRTWTQILIPASRILDIKIREAVDTEKEEVDAKKTN